MWNMRHAKLFFEMCKSKVCTISIELYVNKSCERFIFSNIIAIFHKCWGWIPPPYYNSTINIEARIDSRFCVLYILNCHTLSLKVNPFHFITRSKFCSKYYENCLRCLLPIKISPSQGFILTLMKEKEDSSDNFCNH